MTCSRAFIVGFKHILLLFLVPRRNVFCAVTISLKFCFPDDEVSEKDTEVTKVSNKETSYVVIIIVVSYLGLFAKFRF